MASGSPGLAAGSTVGVVGAGAMGAGIALVALQAGHRVVLTDAQPDALPRAVDGIDRALARDVDKGRRPEASARECRSRLVTAPASGGLDVLAPCSLVIEAVVERLDAKRQVFAALEAVVAPDCVLATNTSSLSIAAIGAGCARPGRVLGAHFFNPAPVMPLVEVVPGLRTSADVTALVLATVRAWGKVPVVAADTPGFVVNRVARPYYGEALRAWEEGLADIATIDWAMRERGGFRMGPFELMDLIGHDVNYVVTETVWTAMYYDPRYRPSVAQKRLLESGLLGRKAGRGFYDYAEGVTPPEPLRSESLGDALVLRVVAMLVNEAMEAVHLRVASRADLELAMTKGVNYPRGLLAWGDLLGPGRVLDELDRLHRETGDGRYRASVLLRRHVREGTPLAP